MAQRKLPGAPGSIASSSGGRTKLTQDNTNHAYLRQEDAIQPEGLPEWLAEATIPTRQERLDTLAEKGWKPFAPKPGTQVDWDAQKEKVLDPKTYAGLTEGRDLDVPLDLVPPSKPATGSKEDIEDLLSGSSGPKGGVDVDYVHNPNPVVADRGKITPRSSDSTSNVTAAPVTATDTAIKDKVNKLLADAGKLKDLTTKTVTVPDVFDDSKPASSPSKQLTASELLAGLKNAKPVEPGTSILGSSSKGKSPYARPIEELYEPDAKRALLALRGLI